MSEVDSGVPIAEVATRHGLHVGLIHNWKRKPSPSKAPRRITPQFVRVVQSAAPSKPPLQPSRPGKRPASSGHITLELPSGVVLTIPTTMSSADIATIAMKTFGSPDAPTITRT